MWALSVAVTHMVVVQSLERSSFPLSGLRPRLLESYCLVADVANIQRQWADSAGQAPSLFGSSHMYMYGVPK